MQIALCDDDMTFLHTLNDMIQTYARQNHLMLTCRMFSSGEALLACLQTFVKFDIIFMDIYLASDDSLNGIETMEHLNRADCGQIVFITSSREHAMDAFRLDAAHYLLKPVTPEDVAEAMTRCRKRFRQPPAEMLEIKKRQGVLTLPTKNIVFIEVINKRCAIHTAEECIETNASLASLAKRLNPATFMRAQRSYLVNMHFIDTFYFNRLLLTTGKEIPLSRVTKDNLKKQYQKFLFDLARRDTF